MNSLLQSLDGAIDRRPVLVPPDTALVDVVNLMHQHRVDYVLITAQDALLGIFTARDLTRLVAAQIPLEAKAIASVMTPKVITFPLTAKTEVVSVLSLLRQHRIRHLPLVDATQTLCGVVTPYSIRAVLEPADLLKLRRVEEVMETQVIVAPPTASLLQISQLMMRHRVSCVVMTTGEREHQRPVGILTERDIIRLQATHANWSVGLAQDEMSSPLREVRLDDSLWQTHWMMQQLQVRRMVVVDPAGYLVGIVTQSSLLKAIDPMELAHTIAALQAVVTRRTEELQLTNAQLQAEVAARQAAETTLRQLNQTLEERVQERTIALMQAEERYRTLVEHTPDAILRLDPTGRLMYANAASVNLLGLAATACHGTARAALQLADPNLTLALQQAIQQVLTTRVEVSQTIQHQTPSGDRWIQVRFVPEMEPAGAVTTVLAIARDVTSLKQAELDTQRALTFEQELNTLKDSFIATVSHEFRTPLTIITMGIELLGHERDREAAAQQQVRTSRLLAATEYMTDLLDDFATISSLMGKQYDLMLSLTNIATLCQDLIAQYQTLQTTPCTFKFEAIDERPPTLQPLDSFVEILDGRLLRIAINNLLANAVKFSPQPGTIQITLRQTATAFILHLTDQGMGIPPADLPHVGQRFFRASNTAGIRGNGMGLAIAQQCLEYLRGSFTIASQLDQGTTVTLQIPQQIREKY